MTRRSAVVLIAVAVCVGSLAWAQPAEPPDPPLVNWGAPPYWTPPVATEPELAAETAEVTRIERRLRPAVLPFVAITPCRVADTRSTNLTREYGAPALAPADARTMTIVGQCGIPIGAVAVSFNFSVINTTGTGALKVLPAAEPASAEATVTWSPTTGLTSHAAILLLGAGGAIALSNEGLSSVDVTLDINGYYAPKWAVTSVFTRSGDVVAETGDYTAAQVTNVPAGTISATDVQGALNGLDTSKAGIVHTHTGSEITGLTSGGIIFGNASGNLAQSPTQLFWDQTNNRLGIGTSGPTQQLELTGMMRMPHTAATAGTPTAGVLFLNGPFLHNYGTYNTFVGQQAGNFTITGTFNTASGYNSLNANSTGYQNTAIGSASLQSNTTGWDNSAIGSQSLANNTTGDYNTAIGLQAGDSNTTGLANTFLGASSDAAADDLINATAIGHGAIVDASHHVRIGDTSVNQIGGEVGWSNLSDARHKENIRDLDLGLDFVLALRPVAFSLKTGDGRTDMGFLAQDVEVLLGEGHSVLGIGGDRDRTLSLRYTDLIAPMVKAIQEQQAQIEAQRSEIELLKATLAERDRSFERRLAVLEHGRR